MIFGPLGFGLLRISDLLLVDAVLAKPGMHSGTNPVFNNGSRESEFLENSICTF